MSPTNVDSEAQAIYILSLSCKFNLTFYNAAYLAEASKTKRILVTDDKKLAKAAQNLGAETLTSDALIQKV